MANESTTFSPETEMETGEMSANAKEMLERAKTRGAETLEDTVDLIRRHPGKAVALSVVVGAALGALVASSLMEDSEPQSTLENLSDAARDAWESARDGAEAALDSARAALKALSERLGR